MLALAAGATAGAEGANDKFWKVLAPAVGVLEPALATEAAGGVENVPDRCWQALEPAVGVPARAVGVLAPGLAAGAGVEGAAERWRPCLRRCARRR